MSNVQRFGVKYPFISDGFENYFLDTNETVKDKVRSELVHVIFTPKGQRIRCPNFGTDLIKYIFEQNDEVSWEAIKNEVRESVKQWVPNILVNNISVVTNENNENEIYVRVDYSVTEGNKSVKDSVVVQI